MGLLVQSLAYTLHGSDRTGVVAMHAQGIGVQMQGAAITGYQGLARCNGQGLLHDNVCLMVHGTRQLSRDQPPGAVVGAVTLQPLVRLLFRPLGLVAEVTPEAWLVVCVGVGVLVLAWLVTWVAGSRMRRISAYSLVTE